MSNVYVDSKDDHKEEAEEIIDAQEETVEETTETEEECECGAETEEECECGAETEEECECEAEAEEKSEDKKDFDYKVYGKETVEETKNMAEKMINDVVDALKSKQTDWNKTLTEYKSKKPSVDLLEYEDELVIKVDLPRVSKEDVNVKMSNEAVEIEVDFPDEYESEEDVKILRRERCSGKTKNLIPLPVEVEVQEVQASFEDHVLTVSLPKVKPKKVDVEIV
jgi:HSP20 family protein